MKLPSGFETRQSKKDVENAVPYPISEVGLNSWGPMYGQFDEIGKDITKNSSNSFHFEFSVSMKKSVVQMYAFGDKEYCKQLKEWLRPNVLHVRKV